MDRFVLPLLALALLAFPVQAQDQGEFVDASYTVRIGLGDLPTTGAEEPADRWHVVQSLRFEHADNTTVSLLLPGGTTLVGHNCTCGVEGQQQDGAITWEIGGNVSAGTYVVDLWSHQAPTTAFAADLTLPSAEAAADMAVVVFSPVGHTVEGTSAAGSPGRTTDDERTIFTFEPALDEVSSGTFWVASFPAPPAPGPFEEGGIGWWELLLGLVLGALLWALLVSRGMVQRRSRKQVAAVSAHAERAREGKETLQARKRALLAALKELEVAKMNKEVDPEAYDKVKAELKRETVTVMRALESVE